MNSSRAQGQFPSPTHLPPHNPHDQQAGETVVGSFFGDLRYFVALGAPVADAGVLIHGGDELYWREGFSVLPWFQVRSQFAFNVRQSAVCILNPWKNFTTTDSQSRKAMVFSPHPHASRQYYPLTLLSCRDNRGIWNLLQKSLNVSFRQGFWAGIQALRSLDPG